MINTRFELTFFGPNSENEDTFTRYEEFSFRTQLQRILKLNGINKDPKRDIIEKGEFKSGIVYNIGEVDPDLRNTIQSEVDSVSLRRLLVLYPEGLPGIDPGYIYALLPLLTRKAAEKKNEIGFKIFVYQVEYGIEIEMREEFPFDTIYDVIFQQLIVEIKNAILQGITYIPQLKQHLITSMDLVEVLGEEFEGTEERLELDTKVDLYRPNWFDNIFAHKMHEFMEGLVNGNDEISFRLPMNTGVRYQIARQINDSELVYDLSFTYYGNVPISLVNLKFYEIKLESIKFISGLLQNIVQTTSGSYRYEEYADKKLAEDAAKTGDGVVYNRKNSRLAYVAAFEILD